MLHDHFLPCSFKRLIGDPGVPISAMSPVPIVCRIGDTLSVEMNKDIADQQIGKFKHIGEIAD